MAELLDEDAAARRAGAVLAQLAALDVHAGDRIAVLAGTGSGFVAARDAEPAADLVLAPINPRLAGDEIAWIVAHARPRAMRVDAAHRDTAPAGVPCVDLDALAEAPPAGLAHARIGATLLSARRCVSATPPAADPRRLRAR